MALNPNPLVSIVVPSFRQGRFLRQSLESLAAQSYPRVEVILRDNQSDDGTEEVLRDFASRIHIVRERDQGQADALRRGFAECRGEILGWLNADDMLMPRAIERVVEVFLSAERPDVVYGHCAFLDEDGSFLRYFDDIMPFSERELRNYSDFVPQPSTFFTRAAYEAVGGIDPGLHWTMDWDLWCRLARARKRFWFLPEVLSGARLHPGAKTARGGLRRWLELTRVNLKHATLPLPMFPILYLAHRYSTRMKGSLGPLHLPLRLLWRRLTGRGGEEKAPVLGLRAPMNVAGPDFRIEAPVFSRLGTVRLVARAGETIADMDVRVNRARPDRTAHPEPGVAVFEWDFQEDFVTALSVLGRAPVGRTDVSLALAVERLPNPTAQLAAGRDRERPVAARAPISVAVGRLPAQ